MPLSDVEREITQAVVARFLNEWQSTPHALLIRRYRSLQALQHLTTWPILRKSGANDEDYLPLPLAFHYSGDPDAVVRARTSVEFVLRILQNMFEVEMEKKDFTPADVEAHADRIYDLPPSASVIRLGLYLVREFGVLNLYSPVPDQTELSSFRIADSIVELSDFEKAWDGYVARNTPYIDNPERFDGSLERTRRATKKRSDPKVFESGIERYTVVEQKGRGGSGTVFEVKDSEGKRFALKALDASKTPRTKLKRFQNEIQFCLRPVSKHIVRVLDYGRTDEGSLFYVMPYYSSTLRELIKTGIPTSQVLQLYSQILEGVEAAHLLDVCHRDIKPENVLHDTETNTLVLADFGIARFKEDDLFTTVNTGPSERLANFAYAAPEQRFAGKTVDRRADIYALGLLLNEMYTGAVPQGTGFQRIAEVAPEHAYLDELVELMIRQ